MSGVQWVGRDLEPDPEDSPDLSDPIDDNGVHRDIAVHPDQRAPSVKGSVLSQVPYQGQSWNSRVQA